jgi:ABC-2 type transport system permease protein
MADRRPDRRDPAAMRRVLAVAFREFRHTVLTKGFIFGALLMPVIMVVMIAAIGALVGSQMAPVSGTLAVIDPSGTVAVFVPAELSPDAIAEEAREALERNSTLLPKGTGEQAVAQAAALAPRIDVKVDPVADASLEESLRAKVQSGELLGLAIVTADVLKPDPRDAEGNPATFALIVPTKSPPRLTGLLEKAVATSIVKARVKAAGTDYSSLNSLLSVPGTSVRRLAADGTEASESKVAKTLLPMGFMMLLWIATFTSGNYLLTTTIEEKSNKVMEVVLSAVSPMQLLCGKILGYAAVSALMLLMYGGLGIAALAAAAMGDLVSPGMLALMLVYFVMAYAFVSIMMASVGSAVNDLREAQSLVTPAMLVLMLPLMLWLPISEQPNGWLATIASFVPPAIPFVMILRVTASSEPIAIWQVALSIVWGFAWVGVFLWAGAKIFRVGVLMQGKPPTPKELLKWVRMA